ncbi:MAG: hypothetical protein R3341_02625 [Methylophaga sp.]|nr:hypothetical protein [Methylophaga sp.]
MTPSEELKDIVSSGIALDLFDAEEVMALDEIVGRNADAINEASYGQFFGSLQRYINRVLILSVARIFESNNRHKIRSIPAALKLMRENSEDLKIPERPTLIKEMVNLGYTEDALDKMTEKALTELVINHFEEVIPKAEEESEIELESALYALKTIRNKNVAHHEAVEWNNLPKPTYSQLRELIEIAKDFVSVVGLPYLSTVYRCDRGDYLLSSDAGKTARCMGRMLKKLGVIKDD